MGSRLDRVRDFVSLAKAVNFRAKELADHCQVSLRQLERYWIARFSDPPQHWLNLKKIEEAKRMLEEGASVKETAFSVGFKQVSHFSREFKKYTGTKPSQYYFKHLDQTKLSPEDN